jgi:hypothetical protein
LIGGLALLGVIGCLLLYQNHNRRKVNQKLNRMNESLKRPIGSSKIAWDFKP